MVLNGGFGRSAAAVWQNLLNTFIVASDNRGSQTINSVWKDGLPNATLVSDRWAAQLKATVQNHQLCLAHLLRELIFLEESEKLPLGNLTFAKSFKELIVSIFDTRKILTKAYLHNSVEAIIFENTLNELLLITIDKEICPNTAIFQASMIKYRNYLLPCLYNLDIPPDNNGSERAIRNVKRGPPVRLNRRYLDSSKLVRVLFVQYVPLLIHFSKGNLRYCRTSLKSLKYNLCSNN